MGWHRVEEKAEFSPLLFYNAKIAYHTFFPQPLLILVFSEINLFLLDPFGARVTRIGHSIPDEGEVTL